MFNDDLKKCELDNVALQAQMDVYEEQLQKCQDIITHLSIHYVDHAKDPGKDNVVMIIGKKYCPQRKMSFMSIPTILWGYNDGSLTQKNVDLRHNIPIIDL